MLRFHQNMDDLIYKKINFIFVKDFQLTLLDVFVINQDQLVPYPFVSLSLKINSSFKNQSNHQNLLGNGVIAFGLFRIFEIKGIVVLLSISCLNFNCGFIKTCR